MQILTPQQSYTYIVFYAWRHLDVTALHCSLLLNSCLIKVNFKPFDSWGCLVPDILFKIVDKLR